MRIAETYSHLNGLEYILVHKPQLWEEIQDVIQEVDGNACKTNISKKRNKKGNVLFSSIEMNKLFKVLLENKE